MESNDLEKELREKLPPQCIGVSVEERLVAYYDYHGVTFRESESEQVIVNDYIVSVVAEKAGFPVRITEWGPSNNGRFAHYFERVSGEER